MQVQVKKSFYQSFGGINFIEEDIRKINFDTLVTQTLGSRSLKLPVYLQNRNGNTPESYNQKSSIAAALEQCMAQKLTVNKFRADACCYEKDTIQYLEKSNITY